VIVHRGAQVLARAGVQRHEPQLRSSGGKVDGRRAGAVGDAHDERLAAAVLEELLDRVGDRRRLPQPGEVPLELAEATDGEHLGAWPPRTARVPPPPACARPRPASAAASRTSRSRGSPLSRRSSDEAAASSRPPRARPHPPLRPPPPALLARFPTAFV